MRWLLLLGFWLLPTWALAQTHRCTGEAWSEVAEARFGDAQLGPLLAAFNRQAGQPRCPTGKFLRLPATIRHEVQLGQTLKTVANRFCRGAGAVALLRQENQLPPGTEPNPGQVLRVPAELELPVGSRPEAELSALVGLPPLATIRAYNGLGPKDPFTPGGTVYVPLFLTLRGAASAPPVAQGPPPSGASPPPSKSAPPPSGQVPPTNPVAGPTEPGPPPSGTPPPVPSFRILAVARPAAFEHALHRQVLGSEQCGLCHRADPRFPEAYLPIAAETCTACHSAFVPTERAERTARLPLVYSHGTHLDPGGKVRADGYSLECATCHPAVEASGRRGLAAHAECQRCHNPSEAQPAVATDCQGCHGLAEQRDRRREQQQILDAHYQGGERGTDIFFGHEIHLAAGGVSGDAACLGCHPTAQTAESPEAIPTPRMADCLGCHRGLVQTLLGEAQSLDRCRTCHLSTSGQLAPIFEAVLDKPLSHTRAFRRRHGPAAAADDGVCAACHYELVGDRGAQCQRCHQQIRPEDHSPRWREEPHGRSAVRNPDRCATCHQRERCADCHAEPPRDHFPRAVFQLRHARQARVSPRRCLTCHQPEADCGRCHDVLSQ